MNLIIKKIEKIQENTNIIFLCPKGSDLKPLQLTENENTYVDGCIRGKETFVEINRYRHWLFIQFYEKNADKSRLLENLRKAGSKLHSSLCARKIEKIVLSCADEDHSLILAYTEGLALSNYQFLKYVKVKKEKQFSLKEIGLFSSSLANEQISRLNSLIDAVYRTRDMVNEPVSFLDAAQLSKEIAEMGKASGFKVEVLEKRKIESLKMGGLLAVNRGSVDPPTFTIMEWNPGKAINKKPIVLVGKGIVFDTGGLSLKPTSDSMDYMKSDMSGAAAVAATIYAVAKEKLPLHLVGLVPATDNRPGNNAYTPGDIITMYDGTTVEMLNADAEGRMILADALAYAAHYEPELIIELSTLTGAAVMAVGPSATVGMGTASSGVFEKLIESGDNVGERIVQFPFWDEYEESLKSDIADIKNIGARYAGAITAGKFLAHFTKYPFIHLDIAGPAWTKETQDYKSKGGTGVGVRLLFDFFTRKVAGK